MADRHLADLADWRIGGWRRIRAGGEFRRNGQPERFDGEWQWVAEMDEGYVFEPGNKSQDERVMTFKMAGCLTSNRIPQQREMFKGIDAHCIIFTKS